MQLIKLHTTIPTHSQLHQAGITSTYSFQSKYLKVHATDQTALNYTNPQPTTLSYTYLLWFTFKYINYFPESTLVLAVLSYINPHSTMPIYTQLHRTIVSLRNRTAGRRGREIACAWQTWQGYYLRFLSWSSLTSMFSDLLRKDLFKGKWSLAKSCFKQNYCHACHTRFAVLFPLPSCCVSSQILEQYWTILK